MSKRLLVSGVVTLALLVTISTGCGSSQNDWVIRLDRLRVDDAQEEDWYSDGDEPYFVVIGFRSTFDTPGSTSAFWGGHLDDEWAEGSYDGDEHDIPARMGVVSFPAVEYVSTDELRVGTKPEVIGALVIALESDSTPWGTVRDIAEDLRNSVEEEARRLIENRPVDATIEFEDVEQAVENVRGNIDVDFWDVVESFGDFEDVVGTHVFIFVPTVTWREPEFPDDGVEQGAHIGALYEQLFTWPDDPIRFQGAGATYLVDVAVDSVPPTPTP